MILDETSGREQENVRRRRYIEKVDEANETRERERLAEVNTGDAYKKGRKKQNRNA